MLNSNKLICPHCGKELDLDEIYAAQMKDRFETEVETRANDRVKILEEDLKAKYAKSENDAVMRAKEENNDRIEQLNKTIEFLKESQEASSKERNALLETVLKLKEELSEANNKAQKEIADKYDELYNKAVEKASEDKDNEIRLLKKKLQDTEELANELKNKAEQRSQQLQGEVEELRLEEDLKSEFPMDVIEEVDKGKLGADVIQTVIDRKGKACGKIVWECKNVKTWKNEFSPKLRNDVQQADGDIGILVSNVFGRNMSEFTLEGGVWLIRPVNSMAMARMIRDGIIKVKEARAFSERKETIQDEVYAFVTSQGFRNRIENIGRQYMMLDAEINKTKIDMDKHWAAQRKLIDGLVENTQGMLGEVSTFLIEPEDDKKLIE